ncbi:MAG: sugar phosphate isomerase/epimerase family protein [Flavobacteriales bacterium]
MNPVPELGMSQFTTLPFSFENDVELCKTTTLKHLEFCEAKLSRDPRGARKQLEKMQEIGVTPVSFQPRVHSLFPDSMAGSPDDPKERVQEMCNGMDRFAEVFQEPDMPCVVIGGVVPKGAVRKGEETFKELLPRLCDHAAKLGFTMAYETIHPVLVNNDTFTWKLDDAIALVDAVGRKELGFVVDTWHVYWEPGLAKTLKAIAPRVRVVHLSDHPKEGPRIFLDRLVLGTGAADFPMIFKALDEGGYKGPWCIELLSDKSLPDSLWDLTSEELMAKNREAFGKLWKEAGSRES